MISVIVPVYQAAKTLDDCVKSILAQDYEDIELILVDDGSSDGSGAMCDSYDDPRIRVLHRENKGAAAARNAGVAASSGTWICFVDSDDVIAGSYLSALLSAALETGADIVSCAHVKCHRDDIRDTASLFKTSSPPHISVYKGHDGVRALLYQKGFLSAPWGMISKKSLWDDVSFPEGTAAEDMGTIYRLFLSSSCTARTDQPLYGYVMSADNTVFSTSSKRNPDYLRHSRRMLSYMKKNHPDCLKAAASRHLSTCFQILSETPKDTADRASRELMTKAYSDIRLVRSTVIKDPKARIRNRAVSLLSYSGIGWIHSYLHRKYLSSIPPADTPANKKKTVSMVEYQGRCDEKGAAVGHAPKVLKEYFDMIKDEYRVTIFAPDTIIKSLPDDTSLHSGADIFRLPHHIIMKSGSSVFKRAMDKVHMFRNIRGALKHSPDRVVWFFNVEFYLFLYLAIFGNMNKKIVVTMFYDGFHTGGSAALKQKIFEAGQKRVSLCISAGPSFRFRNMRSVFIPDYACDEDIYGPFRNAVKEPYAVCIGTMNDGKQLEELISAFKKTDFHLVVAGRFYDKERVEALKKTASSNVEIRDAYLENDEYLTLLSRASYVALPYNSANYAFQTSGVMQEAVFLGTVILTHKDILEGNRIPGVGYLSYQEINDDLLAANAANIARNEEILREYERLRSGTYDQGEIEKKIKNSLSV